MIFGGTALLLLLTPLQLLNPILRKVGIDPKFSPLMIGEILYNQAVLATLGCKVNIQGEPSEKIWSSQACGILTYNHSYAAPCNLTNRMHGVTKKFSSQKNITFATRIRSYLLVFLTAFSRVLAHCSSFIDPFVHQVACVLKGQCLHAHRDLRQVPTNHQPLCHWQATVGQMPRYFGKKVLFLIPFFGWYSWAAGHISLDRKYVRFGECVC